MSKTNTNTTTVTPGRFHEMTYTSLGVLLNSGSYPNPNLASKVVWKLRTSNSTPGWAKIAKSGLKPVNDFSFVEHTRMDWHGHMIQYWPGTNLRRYAYTGHFESVQVPSPFRLGSGIVASIDRQARTKVRLKLKDQKTNIGNVIAERDQTMRLVADTATRLGKALSALKRMDYVGAASALGISSTSSRARKRYHRSYRNDQSKAVANGWLELQYGWLPLLGEVHGAAQKLGQTLHDYYLDRQVAIQKYSEERSRSYRESGYDYTIRETIEYTVKYVVYYSIDLKSSHTFASVGLTNPLSIAWEMTPWSFAVDWVLPVGNWLSSLDATLGLRFSGGSVTTFERSSSVYIRSKTRAKGGSIESLETGSQKWLQVGRTKLSDFPEVASPVVKSPVSLTHMANALALLRQTFKK